MIWLCFGTNSYLMETGSNIKSYFKPDLCRIEVVGEKAGQLLHGQFTNTLKEIPVGTGNFNLLLNTKGKVQASFYVSRRRIDCYDLWIEKAFTTCVTEQLSKMVPLSRVTLKTNDDSIFHMLEDTESENATGQRLFEGEPLYFFRTDRLGIPGVDVALPQKVAENFESRLKEIGYVLLPDPVREIIRVENGITQAGVDYDGDKLPQEVRLDKGLHFEKGCYLGQEIIARLHYKGHVNKLIAGLCVSADVKVGAVLWDGDKEFSKITSVVDSPKFKSRLALAFVPYKRNSVGEVFKIGEKSEGRLVKFD